MVSSSCFKDIVRIGIGSLFIIAAILKLITIDEIEIYIYSFNILSFLMTTVFSRLLIAGELILGSFLVFKIHYKYTWYITLVVQLLFTMFLLYVLAFRNDANCHCFGELVELSPVESILKNVVVIALLFFIKTSVCDADAIPRKNMTLKLILFFSSLIIPFLVTPMDSVYKMVYSLEREISTIDLYDSFEDVVAMNFIDDDIVFDSTAVIDVEGEQMIVIVSSGCKYCRLGVKKLSMIMKNKGMRPDNVDIFIWGSREGILSFREETMTEGYSYWHIMPREAVDITLGRFPTFVIMKEKEIVNIGDFRDIDESLFEL